MMVIGVSTLDSVGLGFLEQLLGALDIKGRHLDRPVPAEVGGGTIAGGEQGAFRNQRAEEGSDDRSPC